MHRKLNCASLAPTLATGVATHAADIRRNPHIVLDDFDVQCRFQ